MSVLMASAQEQTGALPYRNKWEYEIGIHVGTVIRHTQKIDIGAGEVIPGFELSINRNTDGSHYWHKHFRLPTVGLAAICFAPGTYTHGIGWAVMPHLSIPTSRKSPNAFVFRIGAGLGWITKPYDWKNNPNQNAIATNLNSIVQFKFGWRHLAERYRVQTGVAFTHFSNGGLASPNFGINMPSAYVQLHRPMSTPKSAERERQIDIAKPLMRNRLGGLVSAHYTESQYLIVLDGPRYPIYGLSFMAYYQTNPCNRVLAGVDLERNEAVYAWYLHARGGLDPDFVRTQSDRIGAWIGNEFLFGNLGITVQAGYYLGYKRNAYVLSRNYNKLGFRYYFPKWQKGHLRPNIGVQMKAHKIIAEYFAGTVGLEFG